MSPRSDDDLAPEVDPLDVDLRAPRHAWVDEVWPDDPAVDELSFAPPPPAEDLLLPVPDEEGSELPAPPLDEAPRGVGGLDPCVLPWLSSGQVDGVPIRVVADPSSPTSTLTGGEGSASVVRVRLLGVVFDVAVARRVGEPELRLGRDALRGRFLVSVEGE